MSGAGLGSRLYDFSLSSVAGGTLELTVINASDIFGTWTSPAAGVGPTPATGWAAPAEQPDGHSHLRPVVGSSSATITLDGSRTLSGLTFSNTAGSYTLSRSSGDSLPDPGQQRQHGDGERHRQECRQRADDLGRQRGHQPGQPRHADDLRRDRPERRPSRTLTVSGAGTLILTASNTYTGATTISGGTLQLGDGVSNNGSVAGNIVVGGELTFANPSAQTFGGTISGVGTVAKTGAGVLTLSNTGNAYLGLTTVSGGTLQVTAANLPTTVTLANSANVTFNQLSSGTLSHVVSGVGSLTKSGSGTLVVGGIKPTRARPSSPAASSSTRRRPPRPQFGSIPATPTGSSPAAAA